MSISRKTMDHPILILIIFALLGMLGIFTFSKVAIALFPDIENPVIMIMTSYPNAGPESIEKTITKPIEGLAHDRFRKNSNPDRLYSFA